mmetsp:Transcript_15920/g.20106  ORF Transcript_15920/g.20106 Transcript_15920/m.20106 type:complete len:89 (+) Transcript_15920:968-1234(+)
MEEDTNVYSKKEIFFIFYLVKGLIIAVIPAAILIYRSRLLSLHAFVEIKKHSGRRQGIAYNKCLQVMDAMFCLTRLREKSYIEFIMYR